MVKISILIPTYNRANSIPATLQCLLNQTTTSKFDYEVMIIDNNSTDSTKMAVQSCFPLFSRRFKYYFEAKQGRMHALNFGIKKAIGDIIVCLDDDCSVEKDYVLNIYNEFDREGGVGFIGGKILPLWIGERIPEWFNEFLPGNPQRRNNPDGINEFFCGPLGILDYGDQAFIIEPNPGGEYPKLFYGANISFRKWVFDRFGDFSSNSLLVEDTEMCQRLLNSGVRALYSPNIKVFHKISTDKIGPDYYYQWYFTKGMRRENIEPIDAKFRSDSWNMFQQSFSEKTMKAMIHNRCQALFNFGQMISHGTMNGDQK